MIINFYTKPDCLLCQEALALLEMLQHIHLFQIDICDIHERDDWLEKYFLHIPVIEIEGTILTGADIEFSRIEQEMARKIKK